MTKIERHRLLVAQMHVRACHDLLAGETRPRRKPCPEPTKIPNPIRDAHASSLRVGQILVEALRKGDKLNEAEELSIEVVEGLERILGESHPDTLGASDSLARF